MNRSDYKKMSKVAGSELEERYEIRTRHFVYGLQNVRHMKRTEKTLIDLEEEGRWMFL